MLGVWYNGDLVACARLEHIMDEEGEKGMRAGLGNVRPDLVRMGVTNHIIEGCEDFANQEGVVFA